MPTQDDVRFECFDIIRIDPVTKESSLLNAIPIRGEIKARQLIGLLTRQDRSKTFLVMPSSRIDAADRTPTMGI
jgi:hypothetical protein